ncbi:MAG: NYN domain-containing protein [Candidatus Aminicenantales bacterium]
MAYLIDGNNLLGFSFSTGFKDPQNKSALLRKIQIFQKIKKVRIILVFDGAAPPISIQEKAPNKKFDVLYPPQGQSADSLIKEILSGQKDLKKFFVVSSDREIKHFARLRGAKAISCKDFNTELKKALKENREAREMKKNIPFPTSLEVNLWLDVFKDKK